MSARISQNGASPSNPQTVVFAGGNSTPPVPPTGPVSSQPPSQGPSQGSAQPPLPPNAGRSNRNSPPNEEQNTGVFNKNLAAHLSNFLSIAAGGAGLTILSRSFSPSETLMQTGIEGVMAFGLPAVAASLALGVFKEPNLGRIFKNVIKAGLIYGATVGGTATAVQSNFMPRNSPMLNAIMESAGIATHVSGADGISQTGSVVAMRDGFLFPASDLGTSSRFTAAFHSGDKFCSTYVVTGDKSFVQIKMPDGKTVYATNAAGFFQRDPAGDAGCSATAARPATPATASAPRSLGR